MKTLKTPYAHLLLIYLPILVVGIGLALFFPQVIVTILRVLSCIFLIIIFFLIVSPYGKRCVGEEVTLKHNNSYRWLLLLFCLQMGLGFIFLAVMQSCLITLPVPNDLNGNTLVSSISAAATLLSVKSGFFPWPIYLLFSISFAYFSIKPRQLSALKESFRFVLRSTVDGPVGAGADMLVKQGLLFSCAITFSLGIAQVCQVLCHVLGIQMNTGLHPTVLLLGTVIFLLTASRLSQRIVHNLWHKQFSLKWFLPQISISLILVVVIFNEVIKLITPYFQAITSPPIQLSFQHLQQNWLSYWQLFVMLWWLGWTPLVGYFLAKLAQGKTLRALLMTGLILPIIFGISMWLAEQHSTSHLWLAVLSTLQFWPVALIFTVASLALLTFFFQEHAITSLFSSAGTGKNIKQRMSLSVTRSFLLIIAVMLVIYLLLGVPVLTLPALAFTGTAVVAFCSSCLGYLKELKE
jgi:choline-glycine betaine transporter